MIRAASFSIRHAFAVGIAIFIAVIVDHYYSFSKEGWIVLSAFLVSQTTRGTPLRQALILFINIIIAILMATYLLMYVTQAWMSLVIAIFFLFVGSITFINRPLTNKNFYLFIFFFLIFMITIYLTVYPSTNGMDRIIDVVIGTLIGILCRLFVLSVRWDDEFSRGILPLLHALVDYTKTLIAHFEKKDDATLLTRKIINIESALQSPSSLYPEWAYEVGFNPGLRSGFRFFLINLERVTEIFFSMNYLSTCPVGEDLLCEIVGDITHALQKNQELLEILTEYFANKKLKDIHFDFTSDIVQLEKKLQKIVPANFELLEISKDYIALTAWVRDIKDLREILLQLVMSLPATMK